MTQTDDVVAKLLAETPRSLRVALPILRCGRILTAGGLLILVVSLMLTATGAYHPERPTWMGGVVLAGLCSLWWPMSAGWQLQIDERGIRRTRLWLWEDVWSWDDFRSGRVRPSASESNTFQDDQRPFFQRSLSFGLLDTEDLTRACRALCDAAGTGWVTEAPDSLKVVTLPLFVEVEASPECLRFRRRGVWTRVAWDDLQEIRLWRPTRESLGRLRIELCLPSGTRLPVVPSDLQQERQLIAIFHRQAPDKCVEFVRFGPPASLHEADVRLRLLARDRTFLRRLAGVQTALGIGFVLIFVAPKAAKIAELLRDSTVFWLLLAFALLVAVGIAAIVRIDLDTDAALNSQIRELEEWRAKFAGSDPSPGNGPSDAPLSDLR